MDEFIICNLPNISTIELRMPLSRVLIKLLSYAISHRVGSYVYTDVSAERAACIKRMTDLFYSLITSASIACTSIPATLQTETALPFESSLSICSPYTE
jgi:hypothetical protein